MTPDVTPLAGSYLAKGVGVGNHIVRVLEIPMRELMGGTRPKIERPEVQQFTGKIPLIHKRYIIHLRNFSKREGTTEASRTCLVTLSTALLRMST